MLAKCKGFLTVYAAITGIHFVVEGGWVTLARFTEFPIYWIYVGMFLFPLLITAFVRRYHKHGHESNKESTEVHNG